MNFHFQRMRENTRGPTVSDRHLEGHFPDQAPCHFSTHLSSQTRPNPNTHILSLSGSPDLHRFPSTPFRLLHPTLIYPCLPKALLPHPTPFPLLFLGRPSPCLPLPPLHPIKKQPPRIPAPGCCSLSPARPPSSCSSP